MGLAIDSCAADFGLHRSRAGIQTVLIRIARGVAIKTRSTGRPRRRDANSRVATHLIAVLLRWIDSFNARRTAIVVTLGTKTTRPAQRTTTGAAVGNSVRRARRHVVHGDTRNRPSSARSAPSCSVTDTGSRRRDDSPATTDRRITDGALSRSKRRVEKRLAVSGLIAVARRNGADSAIRRRGRTSVRRSRVGQRGKRL